MAYVRLSKEEHDSMTPAQRCELLITRFKRQVKREEILIEVKDRRYFTRNLDKRKLKSERAKIKNKKTK